MPTPHAPPPYRASARDRRPSFALRQSVNSQRRKRGRADPELAAIVVNCSMNEEAEVEDPEPPPKVAKEMNRNFFNELMKTGSMKTGTMKIRRTSFCFYSNCYGPLATVINNKTVNINEANIIVPSPCRSSRS